MHSASPMRASLRQLRCRPNPEGLGFGVRPTVRRVVRVSVLNSALRSSVQILFARFSPPRLEQLRAQSIIGPPVFKPIQQRFLTDVATNRSGPSASMRVVGRTGGQGCSLGPDTGEPPMILWTPASGRTGWTMPSPIQNPLRSLRAPAGQSCSIPQIRKQNPPGAI